MTTSPSSVSTAVTFAKLETNVGTREDLFEHRMTDAWCRGHSQHVTFALGGTPMRKRSNVFAALTAVASSIVVGVTVQACGDGGSSSVFDGGGRGDGSADDGGAACFGVNCVDDGAGQCQGLQCAVNHNCPNGGHTTISGTVYDPAGKQPLYNIIVYVPIDPQGTLPPIPSGTNSCQTCDAAIDNIVTATLTDETGSFTLKDVPTGQNIPLVMQIGKWRREIFLPSTADCADTPAPKADSHLPRDMTEGNMPQMAILTGGADPLSCMFARIGIAPQEWTAPSGGGRMHVYRGVGGGDVAGGGAPDCATNGNCPLWSAKPSLEKYDIVILSCEGDEHNETKPDKVPMHDWINEGGKVFATHFHYTWFKNGPADFAGIANWNPGNPDPPFTIDTGFPKGQAFVQWLIAVGAITSGNVITLAPKDVRDSLSTVNTGAQRWIYSPPSGGSPEHDEYFSFNTPVGGLLDGDGGTKYCGRAVFSDIHVGGQEDASSVPATCDSADLTPQEKALEFLFFDLSSCVRDDRQPPAPPTPK
jgi:hypothetical protein